MNSEITFTITQLIQWILAICAGVACVSGAITVILNALKATPSAKQMERIAKLEEKVERHSDILEKDNKRLQDIEDGNRYVQKALLALLSHGIDGNEVESMRRAKDELQEFLISR